MADLSESLYGDGLYGDGYYSYRPIWLFEATPYIPFSTKAEILVYAFRTFEAEINIQFGVLPLFGVNVGFSEEISIPVNVVSNDYIGPFWDPNWTPSAPPEGGWVPDAPSNDLWVAQSQGKGPWVPVGPDMRPNWDG
jgi:hypothetical protein